MQLWGLVKLSPKTITFLGCRQAGVKWAVQTSWSPCQSACNREVWVCCTRTGAPCCRVDTHHAQASVKLKGEGGTWASKSAEDCTVSTAPSASDPTF